LDFISCEEIMYSSPYGGPWSLPVKWAIPVGLALSASVALAQENAGAVAPTLKYHSVFSQYQRFSEQPVAPWRQTNDTVESIGGWQAYAREAQQPDPADKPAATPGNMGMPSDHGSMP
jgi:hypothetical protein